MPTLIASRGRSGQRPRADAQIFLVSEVRTKGGVAARPEQRSRAANDAGVDRPHHERPNPRIEIGVTMRSHRVGMFALVARYGARRIEQERVGEQPVLASFYCIECGRQVPPLSPPRIEWQALTLTHGSPCFCQIASATSHAPRSDGTESKPQQGMMRVPSRAACA